MEQHYSQTEKEALGIVWRVCLHMYLHGTDTNPWSSITQRSRNPRVNRWVLRLQPYRFTVRHIPWKENIVDSLSRLTRSKARADLSSETEEQVTFVTEKAQRKHCLLVRLRVPWLETKNCRM